MTIEDMVKILFGTSSNLNKVHKQYTKKKHIKSLKDDPKAIDKIARMAMVLDRLQYLFWRRNDLYFIMNGEYQDTYNPEWYGEKPTKRKKATK